MHRCLLLLFGLISFARSADYDPLDVPQENITSKTFTVQDVKHDRDIPIRVYLPASTQPAPVILFSHGLGGSRDNNPYLGNHWAKRGYVVAFVQHSGSDQDVWKSTPPAERLAAMKKAASIGNFIARTHDIPAVIDSLTVWNDDKQHPLFHRLDLGQIGMSGHSFGAHTTQAVIGQSFQRDSGFLEPRIDAAVMMSPSSPKAGDPAKAFAPIKVPSLLMTGTLDDSPIGDTSPADRLKVFPHLTGAAAWQVVFDKATHSAFGERNLKGEKSDPRYHRAILALTTAFWDAELRQQPEAKAWLNGSGAKSVLDPQDTWKSNAKAK